MSKKIYCGINNVPKGSKLGSMKECVESNQIRYWGINKIDPKLLESMKKSKKASQTRDSVAIKMVGLRGKVNRLTKQIENAKNKTDKDKFKLELLNAKKELTEITALFTKLDKKKHSGGSNRSKSKGSKGSKKSKRSKSRR